MAGIPYPSNALIDALVGLQVVLAGRPAETAEMIHCFRRRHHANQTSSSPARCQRGGRRIILKRAWISRY